MTDPTTAGLDDEASSHAIERGETTDQINTPPVQVAATDAAKDDPSDEIGGGQISEAGGASLNEETNAGGADAVPDTHG